jgi:hypothetical protein
LEELIFRVDGEVMGSITEPPFQHVIWDLESYQSSGTHYLTLEAVDVMGLSQMSLATPVDIQIELPPQTLGNIINRNGPALAGLAFILLLGMSLFILIARGNIQPTDQNPMSWILDQGRRTAGMIRGILSSPKPPGEEHKQTDLQPYRLIPISDLSQELFTEPISVHQQNIILGNKEGEGLIRIQHPSINAEHTRITIREDSSYQVTDLGATAGTWINYQQISRAETHLIKDGDMIHIGEAAFRFQTTSTMPSSEENNRDTE